MKNYTEKLHTTETFTLPAGRYYIGDPSKVTNDHMDFCDGDLDVLPGTVDEWKGQDVMVAH